ncbi:MAG TPA: glycosyltransferase [Ferruginibacter sp.]|nr:glycosyltransferase [Ferruginibacter sp.]
MLHQEDIKIILHCFHTTRKPVPILETLCEEVHYYPRKFHLPLRIPYIVGSRNNNRLWERLQQDDHPILLEGMHCTYGVYKNLIPRTRTFIRLHNTEHIYYTHLAQYENHPLKKLYFSREASLLNTYETSIANRATLLAVSEKDRIYFSEIMGADDVRFLPVIVPFEEVQSKAGSGEYCLYHGNLSVNENDRAVRMLVAHCFGKRNIPLVVAGHAPNKKLAAFLSQYSNVQLISNPSESEMNELILDAHIQLVPSLNATGVKLKLIHALFMGRHCITNSMATEGMREAGLCNVFTDWDALGALVDQLINTPFTDAHIHARKKLLPEIYDAGKNIRQLITWLFPHYPKPYPPLF